VPCARTSGSTGDDGEQCFGEEGGTPKGRVSTSASEGGRKKNGRKSSLSHREEICFKLGGRLHQLLQMAQKYANALCLQGKERVSCMKRLIPTLRRRVCERRKKEANVPIDTRLKKGERGAGPGPEQKERPEASPVRAENVDRGKNGPPKGGFS